jgi:nitrate/nitrite transport system ATP-binding protein
MLTNGPAATIGGICEVPLRRPRSRLELMTDPTYVSCRAMVVEFLHRRHRYVDAA